METGGDTVRRDDECRIHSDAPVHSMRPFVEVPKRSGEETELCLLFPCIQTQKCSNYHHYSPGRLSNRHHFTLVLANGMSFLPASPPAKAQRSSAPIISSIYLQHCPLPTFQLVEPPSFTQLQFTALSILLLCCIINFK